MGAGGVLPGRDLPVRTEVLHESARTRVTRLFLPGRSIVRKEPLGPDAQRRLRHELAMLERLRGLERVARLVEAPLYPGSIVLADIGNTSLARLRKPLGVDELIGLAVQLAQAVAGLHRRGVMHRDVTPASIVLPRGCAVPGGFRVGDLGGRDPSRIHPPRRDRRDAGPSGAGAGRAHRPVGGSTGRSVRTGCDAVRAGDGRAAVRIRRSVAPPFGPSSR
jgi:hypothetical protein